ncbi:MAG: lipocalin-like domain-containing protein [Bryobacteraceae bacterium]
MNSKRVVVSLLALGTGLAWAFDARVWKTARANYPYSFPRDHFAHNDFQTEWWYYTGNLRAEDGHRFGYELTFFRQAVQLENASELPPTWRPDQMYLAHFALTDLDGREFFHTKRLNRRGPGLAGAEETHGRYWNGNWQVRWVHERSGVQELQAVAEAATLRLELKPTKPPITHGQNGVSVKGPFPGEASQYISFTRIASSGTLDWKGKRYAVHGSSWMDHEFFSEPSDNQLTGWDWFAVQLDTGQELMLYRLRRKDANSEKFSSGTYVDEKGSSRFLRGSEFALTPLEWWQSAASGERYPVRWRISVPSLQLDLTQQTQLRDQELFSREPVSPTYWEGAVEYAGRMGSRNVSGVGYLEMTGYAESIRLTGK